MYALIENRRFQLWAYYVTHGTMLIRSPSDAHFETNIDIICSDVCYVALPRHLGEIKITDASEDEIQKATDILGGNLYRNKVVVFEASSGRHMVVLGTLRITSNTDGIFLSPMDYVKRLSSETTSKD